MNVNIWIIIFNVLFCGSFEEEFTQKTHLIRTNGLNAIIPEIRRDLKSYAENSFPHLSRLKRDSNEISRFKRFINSANTPPRINKDLPPITYYSSSLNLECGAVGRPPVEIKWYKVPKSNQETNINRYERIINSQDYRMQGSFLTVETTEATAKNLYAIFCEATNIMGTVRSRYTIAQHVPPFKGFKVRVDNQVRVSSQRKAVLKCVPYFQVYQKLVKIKVWKYRMSNDDEWKILDSSSGRFSLINITKVPELHIRNITAHEINNLQVKCVVESLLGEEVAISDNKLELARYDNNYYVASSLVTSSNDVQVLKGSNVELPWAVEGNLVPRTWYKIDGKKKIQISPSELSDTKYVPVQGNIGNLRIMNVDEHDDGTYLGVLDNKNTVQFGIKVYSPLGVRLLPKKLSISFNQAAQFQCTISGFPSNTPVWYHNGRLLSDILRTKYLFGNNATVLTIKNVTHKDIGVYQCVVFYHDRSWLIGDSAQDFAHLFLDAIKPELVNQFPDIEIDNKWATLQLNSRSSSQEIRCTFVGKPLPKIKWFIDEESIDDNPLFEKLEFQSETEPYVKTAVIRVKTNEMTVRVYKGYGGEYKARAENPGGIAECRTFVLVKAPLTIREVKGRQTALFEEAHYMKCFFIGSQVPNIHWYRHQNGKSELLPIDHRHQPVDRGRYLKITKVLEQDKANYSCNCTIDSPPEVASIMINLNIARAPVIKMDKVINVRSDDHLITLVCEPSTEPDAPWFAWWEFRPKNGRSEQLDKHSQDFQISYVEKETYLLSEEDKNVFYNLKSEVQQHPNVPCMLRIKQPRKSIHGGNVTCVVRNRAKQRQHDIAINFIDKLEFKISPPNKREVVLNELLLIDCQAKKNDLNPQVKWKYQDNSGTNGIERLKTDRIKQLENGSLLIQKIGRDDPSIFLCFLETFDNKHPAISRAVNIDIKIPAEIAPIASMEIRRGENKNISCLASGDKDLHVEWHRFDENQWKIFNHPCIKSSGKCSDNGDFRSRSNSLFVKHHVEGLRTKQVKRIIQIFNADYEVAGKYRCLAWNAYNNGKATRDVTISVVSVPGEVQSISGKYGSHNTTISWTPPVDNGRKPILYYHISYQLDSKSMEFDERKSIYKKQLNVTEPTVFLKHLRAYAGYQIVISAVNEVGMGEPAHFSFATQEDKPGAPIRNLTVANVTTNSIIIKWAEPEKDKLNGEIRGHLICWLEETGFKKIKDIKWPTSYQYAIKDDFDNDQILDDCYKTNPKTRSLEITGLTQFTKYIIIVLVYNIKGASPTKTLSALTQEALPNEAPMSVRCQSTSNTIQLRWEAPPKKSINGILKHYTVKYHITNNLGDETNMHNQLNVPGVSRLLENLDAYTSYAVQVSVSNGKGNGPFSDKIICQTKETNPSPPAAVKAIALNESCILISWRHCEKPNGEIDYYQIEATRVGGFGGGGIKKKVKPKFDPPYNTYTICNLQQVSYNISVHATTLNKFEGKRAYASSTIRPMFDPPPKIVSFGYPIVAPDNTRLELDCEIAPNTRNIVPKWTYHDAINYCGNGFNKNNVWENSKGALIIEKLEKCHVGTLSCEVGTLPEKDDIKYQLTVRVIESEKPEPPVWDKYTANHNLVQVNWLSRGSRRQDSPIEYFYLNWTVSSTGKQHAVKLGSSSRQYSANPLPCASKVTFNIRAENKKGKSSLSKQLVVFTPGSKPGAADTSKLIRYTYPTAVTFKLNEFKPGDQCKPDVFTIEVTQNSKGFQDFAAALVRNVTAKDFIGKCCYNFTGLHAGSSYHYRVNASNANGSVAVIGVFKTVSQPTSPTIGEPPGPSKYSVLTSPQFILPTVAISIAMFVFCVSLFLYCRRREMESNLSDGNKPKRINNFTSKDVSSPTAINSDLPQLRGRIQTSDQPDGRVASGPYEDDDNESMDSEGNIKYYGEYQPPEERERAAREREAFEQQFQRTREGPRGRPPTMSSEYGAPPSSHPYVYPEEEARPSQMRQQVMVHHQRAQPYENESTLGETMDKLSSLKKGSLYMGVPGSGYPYSSGAGGSNDTPYYRGGGSIISSTTTSSNHNELRELYEQHRQNPSQFATMPAGGQKHFFLNGGEELEASGDSGESETTDPGIRQFTNQTSQTLRPNFTRQQAQFASMNKPGRPLLMRGTSQISHGSDYESVDYRTPAYTTNQFRREMGARGDSSGVSTMYGSRNDSSSNYYDGSASVGVRRKGLPVQQPGKVHPRDLQEARNNPRYQPQFGFDPTSEPLHPPPNSTYSHAVQHRNPSTIPHNQLHQGGGGVLRGERRPLMEAGAPPPNAAIYAGQINPEETVSLLNTHNSSAHNERRRQNPELYKDDENIYTDEFTEV